MNKRTPVRAIAIAAALGIAATWFVRSRAGDGDDTAGVERDASPGLLVDRVWVDSKPEKYTDYTHAMLVLSHAPIGIFQKASAYQATTEMFEYKQREARIGIHFPQTGKKRETRFRIRECNDLPPFDLCLELGDNPWGGPRRYFGLSDPDQERAQLGAVRARLEQAMTAEGARSSR
ncbi:MAG TPA: hypothetical protein VK698_12170 [Kofleriaceae bacterium]|nr:hypothetical protein [Kofleriaceae bacterium]